MTTLQPMKTMDDLIKEFDRQEAFSPAFRKKVLGSIRKMPKLREYGVPLSQIPVDLQAFDARWGKGVVRTLPAGFKSVGSFQTWRSQVRSALSFALGKIPAASQAAPDDDWHQLVIDLRSRDVPKQRLIAVNVLADMARKDALRPTDISRAWLQAIADGSETAGRRSSVQAAIRLIHQHRGALSVTISQEMGASPIRRTRDCCRRAELPPTLKVEVEDWRTQRIEGTRVGHKRKRRSSCSPARATQAIAGVSYLYTASLAAGLISPDADCSVRDLSCPDLMDEIIERELGGGMPWKLEPTTLFEYLGNFLLFVKGRRIDVTELRDVIRDFAEFENVKAMSRARRDWCEEFLNAPLKQSAFLSLPNSLYREARKAMAAYDAGSAHDQASAIALGVAACAAVIWTSLPLRISTLLQLTFGSADAAVQVHDRRTGLVLTTPPDIVKNGYSHRYLTLTAKRGGDPREIVEWFTREVRPRLLQHHVAAHIRRPDLLFGGVSYSRLSSIWRNVSLAAGVPMTPHQVRHALATLMANEPGADYSIIAALLGDTEATIRRNYVFVDQARHHKEGQMLLAKLQRNVLLKGAA